MDQNEIDRFWSEYLETLPPAIARTELTYTAWAFGHDSPTADELSALVHQGVKTATCGLLWEYEAENESLPQPGQLSIILDGQERPVCIIETTEVSVLPFNQVDDRHAYEEGEGDRSYAYWREVHWRVFSPDCQALGRAPAEDMPLVCERFRLVYSPSFELYKRQAIEWARQKKGSKDYLFLCLGFVEDAYELGCGIVLDGQGCTAKQAAKAYGIRLDGEPPEGALVFYDCWGAIQDKYQNWGHVGLASGNGQVIHAWGEVREDSFQAVQKLPPAPGWTQPVYIGWTPAERMLVGMKKPAV